MRWGREIAVSGACLIALVGAPACSSFDASPAVDASSDASTTPDRAISEDAGVAISDDGGADGCPSCRTVFVTREMRMGDLGGRTGADTFCNEQAGASMHSSVTGRLFVAWLGVTGGTAVQRHKNDGRPLAVPSGAVVATTFDALVKSSLNHGIDEDQHGQPVLDACVWTGTRSDGAGAIEGCSGWASASPSYRGRCGRTTATDHWWADSGSDTCDKAHRVYCIAE